DIPLGPLICDSELTVRRNGGRPYENSR
ncbi:hypothetical protein QE152_g27482, partial [Popillia japonica]